MNLPRFALHNRTFLTVLVAVAVLFGLTTFLSMSRREDPAILVRTAKIETQWPGARAADVEELVTARIEDAVYAIEEVDEVRSLSEAGASRLTVDLEESVTDVDQVWDEVRAAVAAVESQLPDGCRPPSVNSNFGDVAVVCLALHQTAPPGADAPERTYAYHELADHAEVVEDALRELDAVASVTTLGVPAERVYLEFDAARWAALGLTADQLRQAISNRGRVVSGGVVSDADTRYDVRPAAPLTSLGQLAETTVTRRDGGTPVVLDELGGRLERGIVDPPRYKVRYADTTRQAPRAVVLAVTMKAGSNVVELGEAIERTIDRLRATVLPPDVELTRVNDLPRQVQTLVSDFVGNLWQSVLIVLVVAMLLMGWRAALIMAAAVPLSMVTAMALMPLFEVELEQFSIASLIIALGLIVDNAIVVSDNCARMLAEGRSRMDAAIHGASSLAAPILVSTLTTICAFLPLLTIPGSSGEYVRSLPIVVSTTLGLSWLLAMTVTPLCCFWLLRSRSKSTSAADESDDESDATQPATEGWYTRTVRRCLGRQWVPLVGALALLLAATSLVPVIGTQFFPQGDRDQLFVHVELPDGSSLAATERVVEQVERIVRETSEFEGRERLESLVSFVGLGGPRLMLTLAPEDMDRTYAMVLVNTTDAEDPGTWIDELRERVAELPGARIDVRRFSLGPPIDRPVEFRLSGEDPRLLRRTADRLVAALRDVPGAEEPVQDWGNSAYEVRVDVDDEAAELAGVDRASISSSLDTLLSGGTLGVLRDGQDEIPVQLRLDGAERDSPADLGNLRVSGAAGKIPLGAVADLSTGWVPSRIRRVNKVRTVTVAARVAPDSLPTQVSLAARPVLEKITDELPPGYRLEMRGEIYESQSSQSSFASALSVSLLLILVVLTAQYDSLLKPLIVLSSIPLALIGALLGLLLSGWPLGFMPMLGIVSLAGVVINNCIILIDFVEEGVGGGLELRDAIVRAGNARMKPIVLTTLTTVGGLLPLALFGGPMWAGMAWAMICGLAVSTGLTLFVIPTLYAFCAERLGMEVTRNSEESGQSS